MIECAAKSDPLFVLKQFKMLVLVLFERLFEKVRSILEIELLF
jgi:hypothetical protein